MILGIMILRPPDIAWKPYKTHKNLLKTVLKINNHYKNKIKWLLPTLDRFQKTILYKIKFYNLQHTIEIVNFDKSIQEIAESKVAICCSGTATLQLTLLSIPTIVIYKTSFLNAIFGKFFVNIDNVVLPNFISGKRVLPFLFQEKCNTENLFKLFCEFQITIFGVAKNSFNYFPEFFDMLPRSAIRINGF